MAKRRNLHFEILESRQLMAAFQMPWPEIDHLSLSFLPDGVAIGSGSSNLSQSLNQIFPNQADWQLPILRAFQTWAMETKANVGLTTDNGSPLDTLGFKQGDTRFGDVRIGAFPMANDVLAVANPYDPFIANTWVGDVFLNSSSNFLVDSLDPSEALYSLMVHEAGHVYGIPHSGDKASPMYPQFQNTGLQLTAADIALLRALYGERVPDRWEGPTNNDDPTRAALISLTNREGHWISPEWAADLSSMTDHDFYAFELPASVSTLQVDLTAAGISLVTPRVVIRDTAGTVVAEAVANDPRDNNLHLAVKPLQIAQPYTIEVFGAKKDVFSVGAYELRLTPLDTTGSSLAIPQEENDTAESSDFEVLATTPGYVEHTYYEVEGVLTAAQPSRTYQVRSVDLGANLSNIFTVVMEADNVPIEQLQVHLFDSQHQPIAYQIVPNHRGKLELQVFGVESAADYFIEVSAPLLTQSIEYEVEVDFAQQGAHTETFVNETLTDSQPRVVRTLHVLESQQFHFLLGTSDWSMPWDSELVMEIRDDLGTQLYQITVPDGAVRTADLFLTPG
jgi:hypothetical protein